MHVVYLETGVCNFTCLYQYLLESKHLAWEHWNNYISICMLLMHTTKPSLLYLYPALWLTTETTVSTIEPKLTKSPSLF